MIDGTEGGQLAIRVEVGCRNNGTRDISMSDTSSNYRHSRTCMEARYQSPPTADGELVCAMTSAARKQINHRCSGVRSGRSRRQQQIGGTKRPQNVEMPLNGCNSELTTRWLASARSPLPRLRSVAARVAAG